MATLDDAERTKGFAPTTKITIKQHSTEEGFGSVNGAQPLADATNRQTVSRIAEGKEKERRGDEMHSGADVVGMDSEDAVTARSGSRGSESTEGEDRDDEDDDDEVNDTQGHNHGEGHAIAATGAGRTVSPNSRDTQRHSPSSSVGEGNRVPVLLLDPHSRSSSTSSTTHSHEPTSPSHRPSRLSSSIDRDHPSNTDPTTVNSETASNRPQSATEFQKFRDHLHHSASHELFHNSHPTINELAHVDALHPNPHHPGTKTEILRIERVYTPVALPTKTRVSEIVQYDVLIPRFSPAYPRILGDYGIGEDEWGRFIGRVNRFCVEAFDPFRVSNVLVNLIALVTLWMSEWIMPNLAKRKLLQLEQFIDEVNRGPWREKGVQVISPRRTAYLNIDIEVQTSRLSQANNADDNDFGQGTWARGTPASDPTSSGIRPETGGANSRTSLVEDRNNRSSV